MLVNIARRSARIISSNRAGYIANRTVYQTIQQSIVQSRHFTKMSKVSTIAPIPHFKYFPEQRDDLHKLETAKYETSKLLLSLMSTAFPECKDLSVAVDEIASKIVRPSVPGRGELSLPCFVFNKKLDASLSLPPPAMAAKLGEVVNEALNKQANDCVERVEVAAAYLNIYLTPKFLASVLPLVLDGSYLKRLANIGQPRTMIEYSQPNSHKAFHVGHMRNAALGDCLVRLYEQMGHEVIAANYFGDEGAHVAKCLWWLKRFMQENPSFDLDSVPVAERGEFLGQFYSDSVEQLDLATLTSYPFESIVPAKVLAINPHPDAKAPKNWRVVTLQVSDDAADTRTVVCGGIGYEVGSHVAYMPLGAKVKNVIVAEKDMMGVMSAGIMMAEKELGIEPKAEEVKPEETKGKKAEKPAKGAKKDAGVSDAASQRIHQFPTSLPLGQPVTEAGRLPNAKISAPTVIQEWRNRKEEVRKCLRDMEDGDAEMVAFWQKTKMWSIDEFKRIYAWLNCRFDHDFFESEVSESSKLMVEQHKDVFIDSNGATGADLSKFGLGFCMVLKSDGSGLYATKDLALAKRKFDQFKIEESIYIVDAAQTLHFKQVFKTLELMGYEQAKKCIHLPYGQVVLPSGKMSSRAGNVILFSQLRQQLTQDIYEKFLANKTTAGKAKAAAESAAEQSADATYVKNEREPVVWNEAELLNAQHAIAVASIKYGMLNHDTAKDIVFVMEEWTAKSGNTGPYMLYAYARIQSIIGGVQALHPHLINTSGTISPELIGLLTHETERVVLTQILDFWTVVEACTVNNNPSALCSYLFDLSKGFSAWYEKCSLLHAENDQIREARLRFITAIGMVIKQGLNLLGITTLDRM